MTQIEALYNNPFPRQALKLSGAERLYRLRVGSYRIIYEVDTQTAEIIIQYIRHRSDVYRLGS
jgi:mRNA interferase RelE/StbE